MKLIFHINPAIENIFFVAVLGISRILCKNSISTIELFIP